MVTYEIHSECLKTVHKATICSKATIFILITTVITFLGPFILAYRSRGFWMKRDSFHEQPDIKFRNEYLLFAGTNKVDSFIFCTNLFDAESLKRYDNCSTVKVQQSDLNYDEKIDELQFNITIFKNKDADINAINLILLLDYSLHTVCPLQMQSAAIIQHSLDQHISNVYYNGEVTLVQSAPMPCFTQGPFLLYNRAVTPERLEEFRLEEFIKEYTHRNLTTSVTNLYKTTTLGSSEKLSLHLRLRYPEQSVYYRPNFWQVLKWAWIQYLPIFATFTWIMNKIKNFVLQNQLVLNYVVSPWKKNL